MYLKNVITFPFLIFLYFTSFGQQNEEASKRIKSPTVMPPDAAAFQKYSYYPVSLSTGAVNVSIPLLSINCGELKESISLDYHTSGIKVNERSTRQGLGWLLNAGGMITRSIQGAQADEHQYGFLNSRFTLPDATNPNLVPTSTMYPEGAFQDFLYSVGSERQNKRIDLEPDLFSYKFGNKSGVFFFSSTGEIIAEGLDPIKIEYGADLVSFKITDEAGTVYLFELYQTSSSSSSSQQISGTTYSYDSFGATPLPFNSSPGPADGTERFTKDAWNLTKIIHANKQDTIYFDYENRLYTVYNKVGQTLEYPYNIHWSIPGGVSSPVMTPLNPAIFESSGWVEQSENMLKKIRYSGNFIEFNYTSDRLDKYVPLERLTSISSKNALGETVRIIALDNNNYFNTNHGQVSSNSIDQNENKRLKLSGVIFKNPNGVKQSAYRFQYNETALPVINSTAQDYWGYYNGQDGNQSLIPEIKMPLWGGSPSNGFTLIGNANRVASEQSMKAFILEEVQYPSGGVSRFEYSSHKANVTVYTNEPIVISSIGGLKIDRIKLFKDSLTQTNYQTKHYVYSFDRKKDLGKLSSNRNSEFNFGFKQNDQIGVLVNFITVSSSPGKNFDIPGYSPVEYDQVIEYDEDIYEHINGYKVSDFGHAQNPLNFYMQGGSIRSQGPFLPGTRGYSPDDLGNFVYDTHDASNYNMTNGFMICPIKTFYPITSRPQLIMESVFSKKGILINQVVNDYTFSLASNQNIVGFSVNDLVTVNLSASIPGANYTPQGRLNYPSKYNYFLYKIPVGANKISKQINTTYDAKTASYLTQVKNYQYEPLYGFLRNTTTNLSNGQSALVQNYYPFDYSSLIPAIDSLKANHIINLPILIQKNIADKIIDANINKFNGKGELVATYSFNHSTGFQFNPQLVVPSTGFDLEYELRYFNSRLVNSKYKGINTSYIWGYNLQHPIAEVKNASYNDIESVFTQSSINSLNHNPSPGESTLQNLLFPLDNNPQIQVKIFLYRPLVGLLKMRDERGYTTAYGYDEFNQLSNVYDNNGNIKKHISYNFSNKQNLVPELPVSGIYANSIKSAYYSKNDCLTGYSGNSILYTVPGGRYSSNISQLDADAQATADLNDNGQSYANMYGICSQDGVFYNLAKGQLLTKNDCGSGMFGSQVYFSVPAGKYTSVISQADADLRAQNEINISGQTYANSHGICEQKGIKLLTNTNSSETKGIHVFEGFDSVIASQFPNGYGSSTTLSVQPGVYKIVCQSVTAKRFTIGSTSIVGTTVTFNNVTLGNGNLTVIASEP